MSNILTPNENTFGKSGIPVHPTWGVMDSTKIQALQDCPRKYFFSYILGWRSDTPSIHLAFGHAWHQAMEVVLTEGHSPEAVQKAYAVFMSDYVKRMQKDPMVLEELHPSKNPSNALRGLAEYTSRWHDEPADTLYVEVAGTVPISDDRIIHTKTDAIRRYPENTLHEGKIYSLEHKTTTRQTASWEEKWHYLFQVGTYYHFLKCMFPPDEVHGIVINGAIFRKGGNAFPRIPVTFSPQMWELWVQEANHWWDYLEWNMGLLYETSPSDRVMIAFPRNSYSCSKFGCSYPHLCSVHANPLQRCDKPPLGYIQEYWDPRRVEDEATKVVHTEKNESPDTVPSKDRSIIEQTFHLDPTAYE